MIPERPGVELLFLGSGNAFGDEARAFSSFLLNGAHLFDCGPTTLQQMRRAGVSSNQVKGIFISHFHGDHFFGLPFLVLDAWREGRREDLWIAGPPGVGDRAEGLLELAFPRLPRGGPAFARRYLEVRDGFQGELAGLEFEASEVEHVPGLQCFAFRARAAGRSLTYSGDSRLCPGLLKLVPGSEVLVMECACGDEHVHMCPADLLEVRRHADEGAQIIVTHLEHAPGPELAGFLAATDLARFRF
jgi:ribonuclease BN (tRNA processing enzyme)